MNRHEFYRPLVERTLVNYQVQYLARRYDFGKESLVARLLVEEINRRMEETESVLGIERVRPFELYVQKAQNQARLPLFHPEYLEPILGGGDFSMARNPHPPVFPVVDRPKVEGGLEFPEGPLHPPKVGPCSSVDIESVLSRYEKRYCWHGPEMLVCHQVN